MNHPPGQDDMWNTDRSSTASCCGPPDLWEAGDGSGTAATPLTCGDVGFSTIHSTYYCC